MRKQVQNGEENVGSISNGSVQIDVQISCRRCSKRRHRTPREYSDSKDEDRVRTFNPPEWLTRSVTSLPCKNKFCKLDEYQSPNNARTKGICPTDGIQIVFHAFNLSQATFQIHQSFLPLNIAHVPPPATSSHGYLCTPFSQLDALVHTTKRQTSWFRIRSVDSSHQNGYPS